MSSPNLNVLTLLGSILTYTSGFLFAPVEGASPAVLQVNARLSSVMLCSIFFCSLGLTILPPAGSDVDSLCGQHAGVWPNFREDVEAVQGVHPASA